MKDLKPFIPAGKIECPKCLNGYMELKLFHEEGGSEYIEVTCGGCGYSWNMETADAEKNREIMEVKEKEEPVEGEKELLEFIKDDVAKEEETREAPVEKVE